jgi:hypothetical protein
MFTLPPELQAIIAPFLVWLSTPVGVSAQVLLTGAILCTGSRTVTSALRVMGLDNDPHFTNYHRVLNKSHWNSLIAAKILLGMLVRILPPWMPLLILIDETLERRNGKKIKAKGCYRDAVRSSSNHVIRCLGLKWISMMLVVPVPWSKTPWSLPFFTVLAPSKKCNEAEGKTHKTVIGWATQMMIQVRRWHPERAMVLIGDGTYAAVYLAPDCICMPVPVTLIARFRMDSALYDEPPPDVPGKRGPKPKKGKKQRSLKERAADPPTQWTTVTMLWYGGIVRTLEIFSGTSLWYTPGYDPVPVKWVVVRDPNGKLRTEAFFSTDLSLSATTIIEWFILRWGIEVTFEEVRAHLGVETQRQWSDKAIARTTPILFGLFSLIVLMAIELTKDGRNIPIIKCAWYHKTEATFSDVIAFVRRHIWSVGYYKNSAKVDDPSDFKEQMFKIMLDQLCYGI